MPLDPIHTLRSAKRLHLKDGVFVSLAPPSVFEGHLRCVGGAVAWLGSASAVERGEDVLECWRQVVIAALPASGVDPVAMAARAVPASEAAGVEARLQAAGSGEHRLLALQAFAECAAAGVMLLTIDLTGATLDRARGTAEAAEESGMRCLLTWDPKSDLERAFADGLARSRTVRVAPPDDEPRVSVQSLARAEPVDPRARLSIARGSVDVFALVRLLEAREAGLGIRCLANTYAPFTRAFGVPCGAFVRGAPFDAVFLDYEVPGKLEAANLVLFLTEGFGPWSVEAAAVAGEPVLRRHEVLTIDRAAVAAAVGEIVGRARS